MSLLFRHSPIVASAVLAFSLSLLAAPLLFAEAPLAAGCASTPEQFSGVAAGATTAKNNFMAAIGGINNGNVALPQNGGFRAINWDGVLLDGTDPGSTIITLNKSAAITINRFESRGVIFDRMHAVANDGFVSENAAVSGLFPAFSPANTFAPYNNNTVTITFVLASSALQTTAAATRGFGAIFLNVETANSTSIEYFNDTTSLGKFFAPTDTSGQPEFLGVLFGSPIVTSVQITLGTAQIFNFNGVTIVAGGADSPPASNLVALDDLVYAEPTNTVAAAVLTGSAGSPVPGKVATFTDTDPNGNQSQFSAIIDWGDGTSSVGTVLPDASGCFDVSGSHIWAVGGTYPISVSIADSFIRSLTMQATADIGAFRADFNLDGKSDIIVRNNSTGDIAEYQMNGTIVTSGAIIGTLPAYTVATIADFNGDGHADLALQNTTTNDIVVRLMNGNTLVGSVLAGNPGTGWKAVGSADFDADGKADIVLQNQGTGDVAVWLMNGGTIMGGAVLGTPGSAYKVVGVGDFNGDGKADVVLQNTTTGDMAVWLLNGLTITGGAVIGGSGAAWQVKAIGDANRDGKADIFLRNSSTGDIALWEMNGFSLLAGIVIGNPGTAYNVAGSADFNGDGRADLLLQNTTTGDVAVWLLNGPTITGGAVVATPGSTWTAVSH